MRTTTPPPMTIRAPGWYPDPQDPSIGAERWWTGSAWSETGRRSDDPDEAPPVPAPAPVAPKRGLRALFRR